MIARILNFKVAPSRLFILIYLLSLSYGLSAQDDRNKKHDNQVFGTEIKGKNAVSIAVGTSIPNGDYANAMFEIYYHIGYKRFISPYVNFNLGFHKYNIAFEDVLNEGFMSFDANLEIVPFGDNVFSPFLFAGGGYNASNYFKATELKMQGGAGFEIMAYSYLGIKLYGEYNYMFSDELDGRIFGESDDAFWRFAIGLNFYFGKRGHKKVKKGERTVIKSNPIIH